MTPSELATELGIEAKTLRAWVRRTWPREANERGTRHNLSPAQVTAARERWGADASSDAPSRRHDTPRSRAAPNRSSRRDSSDEAYVLDLVDVILAAPALRQHRFTWLLGDPGASGSRVALPVDGYWPHHKLVLEYRERQHDQATPFFDRPDRLTVSGVHRGEQRRRYDERREREIPARGLKLLIVKPHDLAADGRGRLLRRAESDRAVLRILLRSAGIET